MFKLYIYKVLFYTSLIILLLGGCENSENNSSAAEACAKKNCCDVLPKGKEFSLLPLKKGNEWQYDLQTTLATKNGNHLTDSTALFKVLSVEEGSDFKKATLEISFDGRVVDKQSWLINSKGIYQLTMANQPYSSPKPIFVFPAKENQTFSWSGLSPLGKGVRATTEVSGKIIGVDRLEICSKSVDACSTIIKESWKTKAQKGDIKISAWWVPNIGLAIFEQQLISPDITTTNVFKLKSYHISSL